MSRLVLAFKLFFLTLFNRRVYEAVREAYDRVRSGAPAPEPPKAKGPKTNGARPKAEELPPNLGTVASVLSLMQREGRFVDFLMEDIEAASDAQIGAVSRTVHRGCRKALKEYIEVQPVRAETEGDRLTVEPGFDAGAIRLTGNVSGDPPFCGTLRHHGWKISRVNLPVPVATADSAAIIMPAEVEI